MYSVPLNVNWRRYLATVLVIPSRKDNHIGRFNAWFIPRFCTWFLQETPCPLFPPLLGVPGRWGLEHTAAQLVSSVRMAVGDLAAMNGHDALGGRRDNSPTCWNPVNGLSELPA